LIYPRNIATDSEANLVENSLEGMRYWLRAKGEGSEKIRMEVVCLFKEVINKSVSMASNMRLLVTNDLMYMKEVVDS
jgi:hypothetical protein